MRCTTNDSRRDQAASDAQQPHQLTEAELDSVAGGGNGWIYESGSTHRIRPLKTLKDMID